MSAGELMECCASISRLRTSTDARPVTTTCQCYLSGLRRRAARLTGCGNSLSTSSNDVIFLAGDVGNRFEGHPFPWDWRPT